MGFFASLFGIDITGNGKADMLDDAILLGLLEEDERREDTDDDDLDDAVMSGALDE